MTDEEVEARLALIEAAQRRLSERLRFAHRRLDGHSNDLHDHHQRIHALEQTEDKRGRQR
jgi:hypothetical protein